MATFRHILAWVLVIGVLVALLFPLFAQPKTTNDKIGSTYDRIAQSLSIYAADYDEIFPPATSEVSFRVLVFPYIKASYVFTAMPYSGATHFNFNLAGVSMSAPPYPGTHSVSQDHIVLTYARNPKERDQFFVYFLSNRRGILTNEQLLKALQPQFDRKGVKLFPSDYLADQDPLKETK